MESTCRILFDQNDHGTYFTGQVATGKVSIEMHKSRKFKGIYLEICGFAAARWRDRRSGPRKEHYHKRRIFSAREDYIASTIYLLGSENGQVLTVDAGTHSFTFACTIPPNCPSSFEGAFGHIRYVAKVCMLRPGASKQVFTVGFTVLKVMDLNQDAPLLKMPANTEAMQRSCWITSKPVILTVAIAQTGYVPGQLILVDANVNNQTNSDVLKVCIFLNLLATYTSDKPRLNTKTQRICLVKRNCVPISRRSQREFSEAIRVPATPPTCEQLSKVVRISYEVFVVAVMSGIVKNPKAVIPITIGNVPLQNDVNRSVPQVSDPSTTAHCEVSPSSVVEPPPPTYEEAMFMTADIEDGDLNNVNECVPFRPRYPVFDVDGIILRAGLVSENQPTVIVTKTFQGKQENPPRTDRESNVEI